MLLLRNVPWKDIKIGMRCYHKNYNKFGVISFKFEKSEDDIGDWVDIDFDDGTYDSYYHNNTVIEVEV